MSGASLQIIVGLGNPGSEYQRTRHNAGFWFVDALAELCAEQFRVQARYQGEVCRVKLYGQELTLLKPHTFMNRSGLAVHAIADYLKVTPDHVLVVHDELDLMPGVARFKFAGGHGGHNGLRDVMAHMGAHFWRLRLGVGHPGDKKAVTDYVLRRPSQEEEPMLQDAITRALAGLKVFIEQGAEQAMHCLHSLG